MIIKWFGDEIKRVYGVLNEEEAEQDQRQLLELIESKGGSITVRDLQRASRQYRGSVEDAGQAMQGLVDVGWGQWQNVPPGPDGGKPTKRFVIAGDNTLTGDP